MPDSCWKRKICCDGEWWQNLSRQLSRVGRSPELRLSSGRCTSSRKQDRESEHTCLVTQYAKLLCLLAIPSNQMLVGDIQIPYQPDDGGRYPESLATRWWWKISRFLSNQMMVGDSPLSRCKHGTVCFTLFMRVWKTDSCLTYHIDSQNVKYISDQIGVGLPLTAATLIWLDGLL